MNVLIFNIFSVSMLQSKNVTFIKALFITLTNHFFHLDIFTRMVVVIKNSRKIIFFKISLLFILQKEYFLFLISSSLY